MAARVPSTLAPGTSYGAPTAMPTNFIMEPTTMPPGAAYGAPSTMGSTMGAMPTYAAPPAMTAMPTMQAPVTYAAPMAQPPYTTQEQPVTYAAPMTQAPPVTYAAPVAQAPIYAQMPGQVVTWQCLVRILSTYFNLDYFSLKKVAHIHGLPFPPPFPLGLLLWNKKQFMFQRATSSCEVDDVK